MMRLLVGGAVCGVWRYLFFVSGSVRVVVTFRHRLFLHRRTLAA
jgi:hypothetical protein